MKKAKTVERADKTPAVEKLDAELAHEQNVKRGLEKNLERDIATQLEAEKARDEIAYAALSDPANQDATKQLDERETTIAKSAIRIQSAQKALAVSNEKIAQLREQKAVALRQQQMEKYKNGIADLMTGADDFEKKLVAFTQEREKIETQFGELNRLSFGLFESDAMPHKNLPRAFRWCLEQRLGIDTPYRDRNFRERFRAPVNQVFERIMSRAESTDEQEETNESTKKAKTGGE
jgi:hypothetical protein